MLFVQFFAEVTIATVWGYKDNVPASARCNQFLGCCESAARRRSRKNSLFLREFTGTTESVVIVNFDDAVHK